MRKILLYISLMVSVLAMAQTSGSTYASGFPYECGFEEKENLSAWVLNAGSQITNDQWMIGKGTHSTGKRALYISSDSVASICGGKPNVAVAYLRYKFPTETTQKTYDISFDWKGGSSAIEGQLYVMVCLESELTDPSSECYLDGIVSATSGKLLNTVPVQPIGEDGKMFVRDSARWQCESLTREVRVSRNNSSEVFAIVFIWVNSNTDPITTYSSIAIDNVQINSSASKKPWNMEVVPQCEDSAIYVSWDGVSNAYDLQYRRLEESIWRTIPRLTDGSENFTRVGNHCTYTINHVDEGGYDIRVRGVSGLDNTNYVYCNQVFVYCPDNHCINYLQLDDKSRVTCTYGFYPDNSGKNPYMNNGIVDLGPESEDSRHTVHRDPSETDPRTKNMLHTVPEGAVASVRLGNWKNGGEAESITYNITVDAENQGVLIVRYAVVLQDPSHDDSQNQIKIEVLDKDGNEIGGSCGQADFTFNDAVGAGWETCQYGRGREDWAAWKDWTTIGINIQPYDGQDIKVRLTTMDCGLGHHFGYAYFTLDCVNAYLSTNNYANDDSISCVAPEGFNYLWTKVPQGDTVGYERELKQPANYQKYQCKLSFLEDTACNFTVNTVAAPRFPVAAFEDTIIYGDCKSLLSLTNKSYVRVDSVENPPHESCNAYDWIFRRLSDGYEYPIDNREHPVFTCPSEGDDIEVTLISYIGVENLCSDTIRDTITVQNIIPRDSLDERVTCANHPEKWNGKSYNTDTTIVEVGQNRYGCDSTATFRLKVYPVVPDTYIHDSICSDSSIVIGGRHFNVECRDSLIRFESVHGCDSNIILTLNVNERLQATIDPVAYACADDEQLFISFDIAAGVYDSLEIRFNTPELRDTMIYDKNVTTITIPYSATITPGNYKATLRFHQYCCGVYEELREFDIRYSSSIVEQKWNDVLALLSPKHNGGYTFTAFQWYKDGMPILGKNQSYLYQDLDMDAVYYVEITREDGVVVATCPIQPVYHEQQSAYPTIVGRSQHLPMYMERAATIWYYTISGQLYSTFTLPQGYTSLPTPDQTGPFIIKSVDTEGETQAQVMIVQ